MQNGVPIIPYYDDPKDIELIKLERFLLYSEKLIDVRPFFHSYFKLYKYKKAKSLFDLYDNVFLNKSN